MRLIFVLLLIAIVPIAYGDDLGANNRNSCEKAIQENTDYQVQGIYGSPLESEWHPAVAYVLLKEMYRFEILQKEFQQKSNPWRFDFLEMSSGKTVVFVYNVHNKFDYCGGPNAFFVNKK